MGVLLVIGLTWALLSVTTALVVGRMIRGAGRPAGAAAWTDEVEQFLREQSGTHTAG
jgi:hypothetical protein